MGHNKQKDSKKQLVPIKDYALFYDVPASRVLVAAKTGKLKSAKKIGRFL